MTSIWTKSAILRFWVRYCEVLLYLLLQSYKGLSKTSKSHLIFARLTSFCKQIGIGLARFSEQTFERTHSQWVEYSRYRLIGEVTNPRYGAVLQKVLIDFNVLHLG